MELTRTLGIRASTSIGIGAMVGAGIFVLSGVAAGKAGPAVIVSFVLAATLEILLGLCYAELSSRYPRAGGSYEFVRETMGPLLGTVIGWAYLGAWLAASSFVAQGFGHYLHTLTGAPPIISAIILLILLGLLNIIGVQWSGKVQFFIVVIEIILLLSFFAIGFNHVEYTLFKPFAPTGIEGILAAALVGFLSMVDWDGIVASAEEIKNPTRTIPISIISSILIVMLLYIGLLFVSVGVVPWTELGASVTPVFLVSEQILGGIGPLLINMVIVIALPATANAFILSISRTAFAMARNGLLPRRFSRIHPKFNTPVPAIILGVSIQILFTISSSINIAVSATGFLYIITFIFTLVAFFISRKKTTDIVRNQQFKAPLYPLLPITALFICFVLLLPVGKSGFLTGGIWLMFGFILYLIRSSQIKHNKKIKGQRKIPNLFVKPSK
ncbi:amino acid permease [Bacillaceae bacterium CLA-AA-H227]|uniref:Amino acid permease n=1 Tax=Robertmurraya yapensis (ex Hitch et al 2024) TaxID=3133160 RepID=A0ACC6SEH3_9BACI